MKTKALALILALFMILSMAASCSSTEETSIPAESKSEESKPDESKSEESKSEESKPDESKAEESSVEISEEDSSEEPSVEESEPLETPETYIWVKGQYYAKDDPDNVLPVISWYIDNTDDHIIEPDTIYIPYAIVKYDENCSASGSVYCNCYVYNKVEAAFNTNSDEAYKYLLSWDDFCKQDNPNIIPGEWCYVEHEGWNFSVQTYGTDIRPTNIDVVTLGFGFWNASGGFSVAELGLKDVNGEIVWNKTFEAGLDLTDYDIAYYDAFDASQKDISWGVVGADVIVPDESEEESKEEVSKEPIETMTGEINLIPESEYVLTQGGGGQLTYSFENGVLTAVSDSGWPCMSLAYETPIAILAENAELIVDLEVVSGFTSILLNYNGGNIKLHQNLGLDESHFESGSGDLMTGYYTATIKVTSLLGCDDSLFGTRPLRLNEDGTIVFNNITVYATNGGTVVIKSIKLNVPEN